MTRPFIWQNIRFIEHASHTEQVPVQAAHISSNSHRLRSEFSFRLLFFFGKLNQYANANTFPMVFVCHASLYVHFTCLLSIFSRSCLFSPMHLSVTERRFVAALKFIKFAIWWRFGGIQSATIHFACHYRSLIFLFRICTKYNVDSIRNGAAIDHRRIAEWQTMDAKFVCDSKIKTYTFPIKFADIIIFFLLLSHEEMKNFIE